MSINLKVNANYKGLSSENYLADILRVKHLFCSGKSKVCWSNKSQIKVCVRVLLLEDLHPSAHIFISSVAEAATHFQFDQTGLFSSALRK